MKKSLLIFISLLLLTLLLAACGKGETKPEPTSNSDKDSNVSQNESASNGNTTETRSYKHFYGETKIPAKPEKVVTLQYVSQMLSVGLKPIGASNYLLETTDEEFQGIEDVGSSDNVNFEKILSLQPDLIIAGDVEQDVYDKLSKIAPTVVVPWMDYDVFGHVQVIGDILNRQEEATAWKAEFDKKNKAAKDQIIGKIGEGKTFAIYRVDPKEFYIYGVRNMGFTLYKALGLTPPPLVQKEIDKDPNLWAIPISLELLPDYDADYVFVTLFEGEETSDRFDEIKQSSLWKNLSAVKNNHVYQIDMNTWLGYTPHDIDVQLQEALKLLTQNP
ncbi:ABC transporter substrate-binding protein [Paenibacillus eucommiae]|uniref:Iron complex transport system substrate-binding protein n=1 Tax=Paenibacillus eucommiae TaxID=1355755 RepID=A0ABS4J4V2_9BACL|nr:ABC transporter substrate-binding protein [Paenibacillus eucommiae]MBP1994865.1 iron complex transport system substrate-binding protein [Paenibacillus eucommiae]